jgi:hypothetical protein
MNFCKHEAEERRLAAVREAVRTPEHRDLVRKMRVGKAMVGVKSEKFSKTHAAAIEVILRAPDMVEHHIINIEAFVYEHPELFSEEDNKLRFRKSGRPKDCRASCGLRSLCRVNDPRRIWKDWTLVSRISQLNQTKQA